MKTLALTILALFFVSIGYSQTYEDKEFAIFQSIYGMQKKEIVSQFVTLTDVQSEDFWTLYDAYELKRKEIGKKRFALLINYVNDEGEIKAENTEVFMKEAIQLRKKSYQLVDNYFGKIKKKINPVVATEFYQVEVYIAEMVRVEIISELFISKE